MVGSSLESRTNRLLSVHPKPAIVATRSLPADLVTAPGRTADSICVSLFAATLVLLASIGPPGDPRPCRQSDGSGNTGCLRLPAEPAGDPPDLNVVTLISSRARTFFSKAYALLVLLKGLLFRHLQVYRQSMNEKPLTAS